MSARKDPVTPGVLAMVMTRDTGALAAFMMLRTGIGYQQAKAVMRTKPLCVAPVLDPRESASCSGRSTLDHVKCKPRMGKRAPSTPEHLVTLCEFHHLGSKAGRNWATANRPLLRKYLDDYYGKEVHENE